MKWSNLKLNRCPRDGGYLVPEGKVAKCLCGFVIGLAKLGRFSTEQALAEIKAPVEDELADYNEPLAYKE